MLAINHVPIVMISLYKKNKEKNKNKKKTTHVYFFSSELFKMKSIKGFFLKWIYVNSVAIFLSTVPMMTSIK